MLLGNDVVEGRDIEQLNEVDRVYLLLKSHMRRMRERLGLTLEQERQVEHIAVAAAFQAELANVWKTYLAMHQALAADDFQGGRQALAGLKSAAAAVDDSSLADRALQIWSQERANLAKLLDSLQEAEDLPSMRAEFSPLSQEIGVLAKSFGFGAGAPVYELHCPMVFDGRGAVWYQNNRAVRNPYYGSSMLKCSDRVQEVVFDKSTTHESDLPQDHSRH